MLACLRGDDQKFAIGHLLLQAQEASLVAGLHQLMDQGCRGDEANREALLTSSEAETQGNVRLAGTAWSKGDDILAPLDPFAAGQFQHLHLVQGRDRLEVKAIETFYRWELRGLDPALNHPPLPVDQFQFHQSGEETDMVQSLGSALAGQLVVFPEEGRQLQCLEMMREQEFRGVRHDASPAIRHM